MDKPLTKEQAIATWRRAYRKRRAHPEGDITTGLVKWWSFFYRATGVPDARLLVHIPNEPRTFGKQAIVTGARLKAQGLRKGFPDFVLFVARGPFHALALELKAPKGKPRLEQTEMMLLLKDQGYETKVAFSLDAAREAITSYLKTT